MNGDSITRFAPCMMQPMCGIRLGFPGRSRNYLQGSTAEKNLDFQRMGFHNLIVEFACDARHMRDSDSCRELVFMCYSTHENTIYDDLYRFNPTEPHREPTHLMKDLDMLVPHHTCITTSGQRIVLLSSK